MTAEDIEARIKAAYPNCDIAVIDSTGTGNHFDLRMAAKEFRGITPIKQHKMIMGLFQNELKTGEIHALAIKTMIKD